MSVEVTQDSQGVKSLVEVHRGMKIDLDRGVHSRTDPATGMEVYMYVGQPPDFRGAEPGVYRSAHGTEVDVELARRAGFPVEEHLKQRRINEALHAAHQKVMQEMADESKKEVIREYGGFKLVDLGYSRYQVVSPDGIVLNQKGHLDKRTAEILFDELVPKDEGEV
jgi:hypothetical protein